MSQQRAIASSLDSGDGGAGMKLIPNALIIPTIGTIYSALQFASPIGVDETTV
jgi:3-hydroxyisobutyrate dehydrogenase-like beta-hydroxyacid dehydrogenase